MNTKLTIQSLRNPASRAPENSVRLSMGTCTALNLNDGTKCTSPATNKNGLFCGHHASQVQGLYRGYKRRSGELETVKNNRPKDLQENLCDDFSNVNDQGILRAIHEYLMKMFNLTNRCVLARDYHHSNFYKDTSSESSFESSSSISSAEIAVADFGHKAYLDHLRSSRDTIAHALHRLEKRMIDVIYHETQWYAWVESLQAEIDTESEVEKKRVKAEAVLFQKHRMYVSELRKQEESRARIELEKVDVWDPIESIIESTRAGYIALIKILILAEGTTHDEMALGLQRELELKSSTQRQLEIFQLKNLKRSRNRKVVRMGPQRGFRLVVDKEVVGKSVGRVDRALKPTVKSDSGDEIYFETDEVASKIMTEILLIKCQFRQEDVFEVQRQARAISEFILLRLVIANPSLLAAAMVSPTIDAFLHNSNCVRNTDLRELGLNLSHSSPKLIKSACFDYWVAEATKDVEGQALTKVEKEEGKERRTTAALLSELHPDRLALWEKNRVKVCGKWIYNLPAEFTLPCRGWYQFSMMAGNCSSWDAISICTSWNEFFDLNILALNGFLQNWFTSLDHSMIQHLRQIGFVSYAESSNAARAATFFQVGGRRRRASKVVEARNYICANISREDPGSWRFIKFLQSYTARVVVYAKDCLTGQVICAPPDSEKWIFRYKEGNGNLNKRKWVVHQSFDRVFRTQIEEHRPWKLQFNDYIDVVVWDLHSGREIQSLHLFLVAVRCLSSFFWGWFVFSS